MFVLEDDFEEISFGYLKSEIEKGYISIYLQDGGQFYHDTYILKVRDRDVPIVDNGYRIVQSPCILLTEQGCKLSYKERPTGGKLYIPQYDNGFYNCHTNYTIRDCCNEWVPYKELLTKLVQYFSSKNIPCVI